MLDVHMPYTLTHTWRDFFIHIATICVGLLIAIGLEKGVEDVARHHERAELLAALNHESGQIVHDAAGCEARDSTLLDRSQIALRKVTSNIVDHTPYADLPGVTLRAGGDCPDDPIYKAAKASGKLALLSEREVTIYGELDQSINRRQSIDRTDEDMLMDSLRAVSLYRSKKHPTGYAAVPDEELRQLCIALGRDVNRQMHSLVSDYATGGAAAALLKGEQDLGSIQQAEHPPISGVYAWH